MKSPFQYRLPHEDSEPREKEFEPGMDELGYVPRAVNPETVHDEHALYKPSQRLGNG